MQKSEYQIAEETVKVAIKAKGRKYFSKEEESGIDWFLLAGPMVENITDDTLTCVLNIENYYGGVGRFFRDSAWIRRTKNRVLVSSYWGYDF
jgi:hypothetical protein